LEIDGSPLWKYHSCPFEDGETVVEEEEFDEPKTGAAAIDCYHDEGGNAVYKYTRNLTNHSHKAMLERQLIDFMIGLQDAVKEHIPRVPLQTKHTQPSVERHFVHIHGFMVPFGGIGCLLIGAMMVVNCPERLAALLMINVT